MFRFCVVIFLFALSHHCLLVEYISALDGETSVAATTEYNLTGDSESVPLHSHHDGKHEDHEHGELHRIVALQGKNVLAPTAEFVIALSFILALISFRAVAKVSSPRASALAVFSECRERVFRLVHHLVIAPQAPPVVL